MIHAALAAEGMLADSALSGGNSAQVLKIPSGAKAPWSAGVYGGTRAVSMWVYPASQALTPFSPMKMALVETFMGLVTLILV